MPSETLADVVRLLESIESSVLNLIANVRINPNQIQTNTISQISPNLGLFQAGELRTGNLTEPGLGYTGVRIAYPAMTYSGAEWNIVGVANDVLKFGVNATTGLMYATDATISGTITATTGLIGGWTIGATSLYSLASSIGIILDSAIPAIKVGNTAGNYIIIDGANQRIRSSNYVAGATGSNWDTDTGDIEVNNITARGKIKTTVLEKDTISAVGGNLLVLPGDVLATDMSALDADTLTLSGDISLSVGDIVRMKDATDDEWMEVTDTSSAPTYVVTRDKAASYSADTNPTWKKGQAVVNYGQSGDGGLLLQSGASPALYLFNHAGVPWTTVTNEVVLNEVGITAGAGAVLIDSTGVHTQYAGVFSEFNDAGTDTTPDISFQEMLPGNALYFGFMSDAVAVVVPNGTFETGDLTGWTTIYGTAAIDSTYKHGGSYSVKLTSAAPVTSRGTIESSAFIVGGLSDGSVMVDFWAFMPNNDTEGVIATIRAYNSGSTYLGDCNVQASCYMTVNNFWHNFRLIGQLPATTTKVKLRFAAAGDTFIYIDDITFRGGRGAATYIDSQNLYTIESDANIVGNLSIQNLQFRNVAGSLLAQILATEAAAFTLTIETDVAGVANNIQVYSYSDNDMVSTVDIMARGSVGTTKQNVEIYLYSNATGAGASYIHLNELQADVDTVIKSDTNAAFFMVDAALEALGVGAAPSGSYTLEVTGTGSVSGVLTAQVGMVVNETGDAAGDLRAEGDTNANLFFLDASADVIGIGAAPSGSYTLEVTGTTHITGALTVDGGITGGTSTKFGDGADGDVTISGDTTLTRDMYYNNLTVNNAVTLFTAGFRIFVSGTLTNNGTISHVGGAGGNGGTGTGAGGAGGTAAASGTLFGGTDGGAGGGTSAAGTANEGLLASTVSSFTNSNFITAFRPGAGGSGGGAHGTSDSSRSACSAFPWGARGGTGGAATGSGNTSRRGGGGGGGGGIIEIWVSAINNAGTITAAGGVGGNGVTSTDASGNGGGGGGGSIVIYYHSTTGSGLGTRTVTGGAAGTGGNGGASGAAGISSAYNI